MKITKAIITGGAGFIGSHIADILIKNNIPTVVIDNLFSGRLANLPKSKNIKFVKADINDTKKIEPYFKGASHVFHLAALADIVPSITNPLAYHKTNVDGTVNILTLAQKYKIKKFIYAASSSCYGIAKHFLTKETDIISPQYPYALTKYVGEQYVMHWGKVYGMPVISLRLFNVYGPKSRTSGAYGAVLGVFLKQKLSGKPFTVVGTGRQTRDFTYVTDVATAFYKASISNVKNEIINVGSGGTYSINYMVKLLGGKKIFIPRRPGEPEKTFADISKIKKLLNWKPKVSFEQGMKKVLENINYWKTAPLWDKSSIKKETANWFKYLK
jgi:UDP-glucose 4-epimerase